MLGAFVVLCLFVTLMKCALFVMCLIVTLVLGAVSVLCLFVTLVMCTLFVMFDCYVSATRFLCFVCSLR